MHFRTILLSFVAAGFLVAQAPSASSWSRAVQVAGIDPVFQKHGIKVARADQPEVAARIENLAGPETAAQISPALKPYILLVENASGVSVTAITSILYRYPAPGAQPIPGIFSMTMGPPVAPGEAFIVGNGGLSQALMEKAKRGTPPVGLAQSQAAFVSTNLDARRFPTAESVIDAVVLSDGRVLGPDRSGVIEETRGAFQAMKEVVARLHDPSMTDAALNEWLTSARAGRRALKPDGTLDHARSQLAAFAGFVQGGLSSMGRQKLEDMASKMMAVKQRELDRLMPVKE